MDVGYDRVGLHPGQAFILALAVESVLVGGLFLYLAFRPPNLPNAIIPISVEIMQDKPALEPAPEPETKPEVKPVSLPPPRLPRVQPMPAPPVEPVPQVATVAAPAPVTPAPLAAAPSEIAPAAPAPAPAPPPSVAAKSDPNAEYAARVKAAVQAALVFPAAAAALDFKGRARVEFRLRDRVSSQAHVLVSSGMGLTDRAALQSVEAAAYPPPPGSLQGKEATYQVWVEFNH